MAQQEEGGSKTDLGTAAGEARSAVVEKAEELAARGTQQGAEAISSVGTTARTLAEALEDQSPAVARYVRSTGQRIDKLADDLHDKSAGELLSMATDFGKRQPLALLAGAAVIGFALARVVKVGVATPAGDSGPRAEVPNEGTIDVGGTP